MTLPIVDHYIVAAHYSELEFTDWQDRFPNFKPSELACKHCGQYYHWPEFMDRLQSMRDYVGRPLIITSGHRCAVHNARVGGAPLSQHKRLAVDISLRGHSLQSLVVAAQRAGFTGRGYANTFLHLDLGPERFWFYGPASRKKWEGYV